jgi:hypothetical protein
MTVGVATGGVSLAPQPASKAMAESVASSRIGVALGMIEGVGKCINSQYRMIMNDGSLTQDVIQSAA